MGESARPKTLFDKVWERHLVRPETDDQPAILYIDLHLIHEVTSPQAFAELASRGLTVRRPDRTLATMDHSTPTLPAGPDGKLPYDTPAAEAQVSKLAENCAAYGIELHGLGDPSRGIVHIMGPELGRTQPGMTIVCGDSHTSTHGAFGALAFGIGTTEVGHVLATQCLFQRRPKTMRINFEGSLKPGVGAKDLALEMIRTLGASGGAGYVLEYAGPAIRALSMEGRMTLCNMSIEAGARAGMIAPDDITIEWLRGRPATPDDETTLQGWKDLATDEGASFDKEIFVDVSGLSPMVTYGVSPDASTGVAETLPTPSSDDAADAYDYMGLTPGAAVADTKVSRVFVGSCTNGRLADLREAAHILKGRKVAQGVKALIVPGSELVRRQAEEEGLDRIFLEAGAEWRLPGCSMCLAMNGDRGQPGDLIVSTSNRNFKGRQGEGVRTVLASPATAAASAVTGHITDPRPFLVEETAA